MQHSDGGKRIKSTTEDPSSLYRNSDSGMKAPTPVYGNIYDRAAAQKAVYDGALTGMVKPRSAVAQKARSSKMEPAMKSSYKKNEMLKYVLEQKMKGRK